MSSTLTPPLFVSYSVDDDVLTLDGSATADSIVTIYSGTTVIGTSTANSTGVWAFTTATLADGSYSITATDAISSNSSAASSILNVIVDSPATPVIDSGLLNSAYQENLTGTAEANSTVVVYDGTTELGTVAVNGDGAWSFTTNTLSSGTYGFTATDVDAAANISAASSALSLTVNTTPIAASYFGLTIESPDYNYSYLGGPVEASPTIPASIVRSWDVWSPGNGQVEYLDWSDLNPSAGVYNWTALDAWIATNQASNTQMVYTFGDPPAWAGGVTTNLADFQAFVTAIVTQANGAIKYWEGFNEFNVSGIAPALLVQMQEIIYNTVHTLDPGALVLSPTVNSAGGDSEFAQFLADGGGNYFDIAAFHGYNNSTGEGLVPVVQDFQALLSQYGLSNKPIWDTEWGMEAPTVITNTTAQEAYVSTGLILQAALGVQTEIFYAYDNANTALYDTATGQLTAAGVAYQQTEQWLTGATEPSGYQLNGSVYTVQLVKNGQSDLIVWNSAGQSSYAAGSYTEYVNAEGQVEPIVNGEVTIGTVPVLLETSGSTVASVTTPSVTSVMASGTGITSGSGDLDAGKTVTLTLNLSAAVTVAGGTPTLTLNDGGTATYTGGSGSSALTFSYTVAAGQNTPDLTVTAVNLNAASVTDSAGNAANLSAAVTSPTGTLQIDTTTPAVTSVVASGTGITSGSGDLDAGKTVTLTLNLSAAVTVAGGTPTLTLNDGGTATYTGGSGSSALTFSYTVAAGQNTPDLTVTAVNLNAASVTDSAGNAANLSAAVTSPTGTLQIDTTTPAVTSVVASGTGITSGSGDLDAGKTVTLTLNLSAAVTVAGGTPTLTLNDGGTATYTGGSGSSALTFSYTVAAGQNTPDLTVTAVNLNAASVTDSAGNAANLSAAVTSPTGTLQIDTTTPSVTSVVASGTGITSGSGDLDAGKTVTLTLNLSAAVTVAGGTPTLTLNDGGTATYTGGSGSSALTFSYTVAAGQNTPDLTVTAVNLNAASVTDSAGNAANLSAAVTSPTGTLQIDTTTPAVTSVVASGTGITSGSGDLDAGKTVTLTLNLSAAVTVAGGTPTLTLNDGGTATYTGGSGSSALTFSYTVAAGQNTPDLTVTAVNLNAASVTDSAGNAANLSAAVTSPTGTLQIDTTTPSVTSVVASGTGITSGSGDLDAGKTVTLTLNLSAAVTVAGGTPTLTLNDGGTATYTGGSGSSALTFSYTVAAGQNTPDLTVTAVNLNAASVTDSAGNAANLSAAVTSPTGTLQIDTTPPAAPVIASDTVNTNNAVTLIGTAGVNSTVTVYDGQTALGTTTANASGAWSYTTGALTIGTQVFTATAMDAAGNTSAASNAVDPSIDALTGVQVTTLPVAAGTVLEVTGTVSNTGTIALNAASGSADLAVVGSATLTGSGRVTLSNNTGNQIGSNGTSATLTNANNTIAGAGKIGDNDLTLVNEGVIDANQTTALIIDTGGNQIANSGTFEATSSGGLDIESNVSNSKTIEANGTNAKVVIDGSVTNSTTGLILASGSGAQVDLDNTTISGGTLRTSGSNAFIETVGNSTDALDGGTISAGSTIEINAGTILAVNGTVANSGTLLVNGGILDVSGVLTGGATEIGGAGEVVVAQSSSEGVDFLSKSTGQLVLDLASSYTGDIAGFATTQSIDLTDIDFAAGVTISYASSNKRNTGGVLTISEGANTVRLDLEGSYTLANFHVASDGNGGTLLTDPTVVTQAHGNAPATIGNNTVLEVDTADKGNVTFSGTTGTLWLDQPATFTGKVSGLGAQNGIDLPGIAFTAQSTLGYSPNRNNTGGTLSLTNGTQSASIALLGSYMASSFVMESDNHGGTMVLADAVRSGSQSLLTNPHHA